MRIRDPILEGEEPFNMVPLTDMVFNLLIFFMAATTFAQVERELGVRLPRAQSFSTLSAVPQQLVININEQGQSIVARKAYDAQALRDLLASVVKKNPDANIIIRADERGLVRGFTNVLDACKRAGVSEAKISYLSGGTGAGSVGAGGSGASGSGAGSSGGAEK